MGFESAAGGRRAPAGGDKPSSPDPASAHSVRDTGVTASRCGLTLGHRLVRMARRRAAAERARVGDTPGLGRPARAAGAGAGHPGRGARDAGGARTGTARPGGPPEGGGAGPDTIGARSSCGARIQSDARPFDLLVRAMKLASHWDIEHTFKLTTRGNAMPKIRQKITPFLWFDDQAEEAARFYTSLFDDSRVVDIARYTAANPRQEGSVMLVTFELAGQRFYALNGGPNRSLQRIRFAPGRMRDAGRGRHALEPAHRWRHRKTLRLAEGSLWARLADCPNAASRTGDERRSQGRRSGDARHVRDEEDRHRRYRTGRRHPVANR